MEKGITRRPFDENGIVSADLYRKLMLGKLVINEGMLTENIVAQMLVAAGHKLYFFSSYSKDDPESRIVFSLKIIFYRIFMCLDTDLFGNNYSFYFERPTVL